MKIVKRIALSLLSGIVFFYGYGIFVAIINVVFQPRSPIYEWLQLPRSFPLEIYFYFFRTIDVDWILNNTSLFRFLISASAILVYAAIAYLFLTLISRFLRPKQGLTAPPLPPERFE